MPVGHVLESDVCCNEPLTCAAPSESTLYGMSGSALNLPLVEFSKGLCCICGVVELAAEARKEQKCSGNVMKHWDACPLCATCAGQGFAAVAVRKTKAQSKRKVRGQKRARTAGGVEAGLSGGSDSNGE